MQPAVSEFKRILCIRADNMGDVIMSGPAIRALKNSFHARITLLTSKMGSLIAPHLPGIDDVIAADLPWVKTGGQPSVGEFFVLAEQLRSAKYDLAVIFTVYSQSALPAAMLVFLAGIPRRLAYCRENPYHLLTDWVPDREPYSFILHQVERDMELVQTIGARPVDDRLRITYSQTAKKAAIQKALSCGIDMEKPWILLHPGVSEEKREYPVSCWIEAGSLLQRELGFQLVISGSGKDAPLAEEIRRGLPFPAWSLAGRLGMDEFIAFVSLSPLVISVNTATVHIAAALNRPLIVLYARTNPQHTPWKGDSEILSFSGGPAQATRNEVVNWVSRKLYKDEMAYPAPQQILSAVRKLLRLPVEKVVKT
jgi:lipopolysaccharide heptosyltransferase II